MRVLVLLNATAGSAAGARASDLARHVELTLRDAGLDPEVRSVEGREVPTHARRARREGFHAVVAAGGDGTVSAAAGALAGTGMPLGILPLGTRNHFSRDLGIPTDLAAAAQVLARGEPRDLDVGEVNGRTFVNNASLGVYPYLVLEREARHDRGRTIRFHATLRAVLVVLKRYPSVRVTLGVGDTAVTRKTPLVFIGNNRYVLTSRALGSRDALDGGELCLYYAHTMPRRRLFRLAIQALAGRLDRARDFESTTAPEIVVDSRKPHLRVALDGEVLHLPTPLRFTIRPGALRVIAPPPPGAAPGIAEAARERLPEGGGSAAA